MDDLLPRFVEGGVYDLDCLTGLTMLPETEQRKFLVHDLGLNPFQVMTVQAAFEELRMPDPSSD